MFATVDGISQRAPVHWSENVIGAALCFPYVVALDEEFITVHSMLDQQQKQTLPFKEGHILQDFEGIPKDAFFFVILEQSQCGHSHFHLFFLNKISSKHVNHCHFSLANTFVIIFLLLVPMV